MARWANENTYDDIIRDAYNAFPSVPVEVIKAIIATESGFRKDAIRGEPQRGDASYGLMQLTYNTARGVGYGGTRENLIIPAINVYYGTKLLASLWAKLGNWEDVFSAYNGGIRPHLGFGGKLTGSVAKRICLRWSETVAGRCERWHSVQPGEYANEDYVTKVIARVQYFTGRPLTEGGQPRPFRDSDATRNDPPVPPLGGVRTVAGEGAKDLKSKGKLGRLLGRLFRFFGG